MKGRERYRGREKGRERKERVGETGKHRECYMHSLRVAVKHDGQILIHRNHARQRVLSEQLVCPGACEQVTEGPVGVLRPHQCLCSLHPTLIPVVQPLSPQVAASKISLVQGSCRTQETHTHHYPYFSPTISQCMLFNMQAE